MEFSCPSCTKALPPIALTSPGRCPSCNLAFEFVPFPAASAAPVVPIAQAALPEDSTCFFHAGNQAAVVCDCCGRFLCPVCAVPHKGRTLCSPCIAKLKRETTAGVTTRPRLDVIACYCAAGAFLFTAVWPISLIFSTGGLSLTVVGLRKPRSLTSPGIAWFVAAGIANLLTVILAISFAVAFHSRAGRHR